MKSKQANKQSIDDRDYKNLYTAVKSESISNSLLYKKIEDENDRLIKQNQKINRELQQLQQMTHNQISNLKFHVSVLEDRNKQLMIGKREIDIKYNTTKINYESLMSEFENFKVMKELEVQEIKKKAILQKKEYADSLNEYEASIQLFHQLKQEKGLLEKELVLTKQKMRQIAADKDCEKILTIDSIKKQMTRKANQMKNKALEIRKEQLDTTTRLTFLQNDQLIRQLEYQTSNTDKILKRNTELQQEIKDLKHKVQIMTVVENEVVKRNLVAKKLLKVYKQKQESLHSKDASEQQKIMKKPEKVPQSQKIKKYLATIEQLSMRVASQQFLVTNLEKKLEKLSKPMQEVQQIKQKTNKQESVSEQKISQIAILLCRYYELLIEQQRQLESPQNQKQTEKQKIQDQKYLANRLLQLIRPHLSKKFLNLNPIRRHYNKKYIDYEQLKEENLHVSKYISALKRVKQKKEKQNIYFKGRSLTNLTSSFDKRKETIHINKNKLKNSQNLINDRISKKFMKQFSKAK